MIKTKYKIQYKGNTRRYLVNDRWVTARGVPELREKQDQTDSQYINSERGKIMEVINSIFLRYKHKKDRHKVWYPEVDKKELWIIIMNHIAYMKQKICMVGLASGLALGTLGYTHCCIEDIGILRSIPNLTIISPAPFTSKPTPTHNIDASIKKQNGLA